MILYPLVLGIEFFQHVVVIVLVGVTIVECIVCWKKAHTGDARVDTVIQENKRAHVLLLVASLFLAAWIVVEYLSEYLGDWYHFLVHLPAAIVVAGIFWYLVRFKDLGLKILFAVFSIAALIQIGLDIFEMFSGMDGVPWIEAVRELLQLTSVLMFYFFAVRSMNLLHHEERT